jgi:glycosyltransferase involved in cell wall biosynthesis
MNQLNTIKRGSALNIRPIQTATTTRQVAFVGNFPPRKCGIATFTNDVCERFSQEFPDDTCFVVAMTDDGQDYDYPDRVWLDVRASDVSEYRKAATYINRIQPDVVSLQHEFGIFGGQDGGMLLEFLNHCKVPVVTTLHTILANPTRSQRAVMERIIEVSSGIIVMAEKACELLLMNYRIDPAMIHVVPHGIPDASFTSTTSNKEELHLDRHKTILTFGLIGPGKGLEDGIRAMADVVPHHPDALYIILGATHPQLLKVEGERYRSSLEDLVRELNLESNVIFVDRYATNEELTRHLGATDIYLTPYPNEAQITSGTLAYASGSGCPVVSTSYWHASELITPDRGILVPFSHPAGIGKAINELLSDPARCQSMRLAAARAGESSRWPAVVRQYREVFSTAIDMAYSRKVLRVVRSTDEAITPAVDLHRMDHFTNMTDRIGMWQHAK